MHLLTKPQQAGGQCPPYDMDFSADENSTYGMGKPITYRGAGKAGTALLVSGSFPVSPAVSTPGNRNHRIRRCVNALLKNL